MASRSVIGADNTPWLDDWRRLGIAVRRIVVRAGDAWTEMPADHPALIDGWHSAERDGSGLWRWTNGDASLPIAQNDRQAVVLDIDIAMTVNYPAIDRLAA